MSLPLFDEPDEDVPVCMHGIDILAACEDCDGDNVVLEGETAEEYAARRLHELGQVCYDGGTRSVLTAPTGCLSTAADRSRDHA